ncbi:bifunctional folylpolyglutamate synthase/dihydrofolate synthase [Nostoc sp. FACHB-152]|uniref:bifunctional folylpolyglutamate synthase/dihydrofolate synthase n=1 Tax=unclassified Nostoc TaxID=2593658 RepID=UPI0016837DAA|nr:MULTISPECIES: Mur ligase family protein [unclassified Nostoc]MBD2448739.1 bifunctional folylpolyglutamate synthase/dihydrofolate synthase [Nostoc sp. FACHB-152]MBD2470174.1 bifunctional folylpolyglutamate synthase/dihydrofolate synthase [Nostoc sp. FACHB-145]
MDIDSLLQPLQHFGVNLGLSRIVKLLANLGNPHERVAVIHVAGTNGKGSVCAYLSSVLTEVGYRTGRYISPHLVDWMERICINEQPISAEELSQLVQKVQAAVSFDDEYPTQFEIITAAAWLYFAQQQVEVAVIEVGLGGRLDATNVCSQPLVTVVTSISREHWQQLGPTVADIAREKAGIFKPGCPAVVGPLPTEAEKVVRSRAQELQCPIFTPQPALQISPGWAEYHSLQNPQNSIKYPLPLQGQIQLTNSALALAALEILQQQGWKISESAIINGMAKTKWPGRMQWLTWKNHKLLIDGAHNPAAAQVLRNYVNTLNSQNVNWIIGMLSTKEHKEIFQELLKPGDKLYLVPVPDSSSANPNELAILANNLCPELSICQTYPDLSSALESAFTTTDNLVVLCGSLYLIGHFLGILNHK